MTPADLTTGTRLRVNGSTFAVTSPGAGVVSIRGARGGDSALVQNKRSGVWSLLRNFREESIASLEVVS